jgi:hypothetical protein
MFSLIYILLTHNKHSNITGYRSKQGEVVYGRDRAREEMKNLNVVDVLSVQE